MQDYESNDPSQLDQESAKTNTEQSEVSEPSSEKDSLEGEEDTSRRLARRLIQEMQHKADIIGVLQQELKQDIQAFRLNHLEKYDTKGDTTSNIRTDKMSSSKTAAGTDYGGSETASRLFDMTVNVWDLVRQPFQLDVPTAKTREKKQKARSLEMWKLVPPIHNAPHTRTGTNSKSLFHWCPCHSQWTKHKPEECQLHPNPGQKAKGLSSFQDSTGAPRFVPRQGF